MSVSGWHLSGAVPFTWYFQKVEPGRMVYRPDYKLTLDKDYQEYRQIFVDSGWELVCVMSNWHYYRILPENNKVPEIFNDNHSRAVKYERLLVMMLPFLALIGFIPPSTFSDSPPYSGLAWDVFTILGLLLKIFFIYAIIHIAARVIRLRKAKQE